jgi:hypothetical protein
VDGDVDSDCLSGCASHSHLIELGCINDAPDSPTPFMSAETSTEAM